MAIVWGDKGARVFKFLLAMRNPRIASTLAKYGFSDADLQEGWTLLSAVGRMMFEPDKAAADARVIRKLDEWQRLWFPIAAAALARRFPAVHARVFKNLSQTDGPGVAVSVRTFIKRLDQMAAGARAYGAEGLRAKAILEARGLTPSVLAEARALLETVGNVAPGDPVMAPHDPKTFEKAANALWDWYLEWSGIARAAIKQRGLLRQTGLVSTRRSKASGEDEVDADGGPISRVITMQAPR